MVQTAVFKFCTINTEHKTSLSMNLCRREMYFSYAVFTHVHSAICWLSKGSSTPSSFIKEHKTVPYNMLILLRSRLDDLKPSVFKRMKSALRVNHKMLFFMHVFMVVLGFVRLKVLSLYNSNKICL